MKKLIKMFGVLGLLFIAAPLAAANELIWKVTIISVLPSRANVPADYCLQFSPDVYAGSLTQLQQTGVKARNGVLIKYRTMQTQQENALFFTSIDAVISKQLDPSHSWYTRLHIHLQQLTMNGVADGVWSTLDCKGRLIAQAL